MHSDGAAAVQQALERVFSANGGLVRFSLPDGELGRPGDNLCRLSFIEARPHKLLVELDEQLLLVLTEPAVVEVTDRHARVTFEQLTFDWQEYGNLRPHAKTYTAGEMTFVGQ